MRGPQWVKTATHTAGTRPNSNITRAYAAIIQIRLDSDVFCRLLARQLSHGAQVERLWTQAAEDRRSFSHSTLVNIGISRNAWVSRRDCFYCWRTSTSSPLHPKRGGHVSHGMCAKIMGKREAGKRISEAQERKKMG